MANVNSNTLSLEEKNIILWRTKIHSESTKMFSETDVIKMLEFFTDKIFVMLGGCVFQQTFGIPMGTNFPFICSDIPAAYSHYSSFLQNAIHKIKDWASYINNCSNGWLIYFMLWNFSGTGAIEFSEFVTMMT